MFLKGEKPGGLPAVGGGGEPAGQKLPVSFLPSLRGERPDPAAGAAAPRCGTELPPGLGPGTTTTTTPGQPPRFPPERSGSPGPDGTGPKGTPGAGCRGAAGRSPVSGTRQERTRGSVDRDGPPPPLPSGRPPSPAACPDGAPGSAEPGRAGTRPGRLPLASPLRPGLLKPPPLLPRGDAEFCSPTPHLGSAGRGRAPLLSPNRLGPVPATSRPPRTRRDEPLSEVRG